MRIAEQYEETGMYSEWCVALGSFDGVHLGHQKLIRLLVEESENLKTGSMVYTFMTHPRKTLTPNKPIYLITDNRKRAEILDGFGVDMLFLEDFNKIRHMSAEDFVKEILLGRFKAKCVVVGYNYRFGCKGDGDAELLKHFGQKYSFKVDVVEAVEINGHTVSSSLIRHIIRSGNVEKVPEYLGRPFSIHGKVVYGKQNGEVMGIKTANLEVKKDITLPHRGVYHTNTVVGGRTYKSISNIGFNPTFNGGSLSVETHILDFSGDIYNEEIEVFFLKHRRDEIRFNSMEELVKQIRTDIRDRLNY
ncbi:MAG: bifunctional riboflavin kinase/FAD synthetase [Caulobacteraceae bacterium]